MVSPLCFPDGNVFPDGRRVARQRHFHYFKDFIMAVDDRKATEPIRLAMT
jgi:hypothetical protein